MIRMNTQELLGIEGETYLRSGKGRWTTIHARDVLVLDEGY
jgi:hypothetical protein